jgi:hypothetical protein
LPAAYSICGVGLEANVAIAALSTLPAPEKVDIRLELGGMPEGLDRNGQTWRECYVDAELDERGRPWTRVDRCAHGLFHRIAYSDGVDIVVDARGDRVWVTWEDPSGFEDAVAYLLGSVLGFVLRLRGITCLHAGAIAVDGRAIALVGPSGAGKSSTAAGFARLGYAVLTDDLAALSERRGAVEIEPALPRVHLWPQSAQCLLGSWESLPRITPTWDKRRLELDGEGLRFQREPLPLAAIYFLGERRPREAVTFEAMSGPAALIELVSDSHATEFASSALRAQEFDVLTRLLANIPARRVNPSESLAQVPELCEAIVRDFRRIGPRALAA